MPAAGATRELPMGSGRMKPGVRPFGPPSYASDMPNVVLDEETSAVLQAEAARRGVEPTALAGEAVASFLFSPGRVATQLIWVAHGRVERAPDGLPVLRIGRPVTNDEVLDGVEAARTTR